jgi:FkbM family methyltransferase
MQTTISRSDVHRWLQRRGVDLVRHPTPLNIEFHLRSLLDLLAVDCVLDVGGAVGDYGVMLRRIGYRGRIVSVEPLDFHAARIRELADDAWTVEQVAVGAEPGLARFNVAADPRMSSVNAVTPYATESQPERVATVETREVPVETLDALVARLVDPAERLFVKLDVQGNERAVLRGAVEAMQRVLGLQIELSLIPVYEGQADYLSMLAQLRELSFQPTWFLPLPSGPDLRVIEMDCLLRRASAPTGA